MDHWSDRYAFFSNGCPFCQSREFLEGPHGGLSINFKCKKCEARFNDMGPFGIDLLSRPINENAVQQKEVLNDTTVHNHGR